MDGIAFAQDHGATDRLIYEQVFDNALVGICFMRGRCFVRVNRCLEEMLGYPPGALVGQSVRTVYARQEDFDEVGRVVATPRRDRYVHERALVTRDGVLRWCLISGRKLVPTDPEAASIWIVQDISAKREAEMHLARARERLEETVRRRTVNLRRSNLALRQEVARRRESERAMIESREKYRVLLRNTTRGIVVTDAAGAPVEINPAMQDFVGVRTLAEFLDVAARPACWIGGAAAPLTLLDVIQRAAAARRRRPGRQAVRWTGRSGRTAWFEVTGFDVPVRGLGAAVAFDDQTEQHLLRERENEQRQQLAQAGRVSLMGQFAGALAHELGQPLNACRSYAAGLERRLEAMLPEQPDLREALHYLQKHLEQAGQVVHTVRGFIARRRPSDEPIALPALVEATLDLLRVQIREAGIRVEVQSAARIPDVRGSRIELQQVLVNLVLNAVEAMRDAGTAAPCLAVRLTRRREGAEITVSDNGPGVPAAVAVTIFEPYVTTKPGGLGMGLMLCRTIVESHGGRLWLGARQGAGAVFHLSLPAERSDGAG